MRVSSSVRIPRNCRSRRSSASMVTFVSSSPFHQPWGDCNDRRWSTAFWSVASTRVRVSTAITPSKLALDDEAAELGQLGASLGIDRGAVELAQGEPEAALRLVGGIALAAGGLDEVGRLRHV